ncbi:FtsX-like permease family protein [Caproiciproducens sp. MSJ-32]|uniref:FtsX-like permease family protein n=1 Tax=Caproiciproducens sp. MSJ-32 TaxID=2841527 RepID=UPI001C0FF642|nr:ABC transporter permease [Caproiciproducens sp. MSJ-32]MBU5455083.1 ABC transporter permease [Caproiciproducens sp. MSJ-32]
MSKIFYAKLALINIKKNGKTYFPYMVAAISTIMMFYTMHFISINDGLNNMSGGDSLKIILGLGNYVIGLFSIIFLFYTNSFLIKRRKNEIGLYNILGMEKRHIARVMIWETFFVGISTIVIGLLSGILISKLMFLVLLKILTFEVPLGFFISKESIAITVILFGAIFILTLLNNLGQIHLSKPVELLRGGQVGEKEPKTKWIMTIIGVISLSAGYYIALTTESPLAAIYLFFVAVILVIIGTYSLFTAASIALLKILRKNKKFYYKTNNFINVSGMIYRMKQNAVGLSNICILSTCVLVMLSTTVSLYIGMEDVLRNRYPRDIAVRVDNVSDEMEEKLDNIIIKEAEKHNISIKDIIKYRSIEVPMFQKNNSFSLANRDIGNYSDISLLNIMPLESYNSQENKSINLEDNEVLLYAFRGEIKEDTVNILGNEFKVKEQLKDFNSEGILSAIAAKSYYIVVKDVETIEKLLFNVDIYGEKFENLSYFYAFNTEGDAENQINLINVLSNMISEASLSGYAEGLEESRGAFFSLYGGLFFLGLFLGFLFIMATVLIMYYKQVSEGYDDKQRFEIMQKVGLSKEEVKKSIKSQVLMVFFLPLLMAIIHIAFAFKVITKLLSVLNLTNVTLFALCTVGTILVFAVFYGIVYSLTARVYYKLVS